MMKLTSCLPSGFTMFAASMLAQRYTGLANGTATVSQRNEVKYVPAGTGPAYWGAGDEITFSTETKPGAPSSWRKCWSRQAEVRRCTSLS